MSTLDFTRLRELLDYNPTTGIFTWRHTVSNRVGGTRAGADNRGYQQIKIDRKLYQAHRLAWCYVYGSWPPHMIDHINGIKHDNRVINLRLATNQENQQNRRTPQGGNPYIGVSWHKGRQLWQSQIRVQGKPTHLGYFGSAEEAFAMYTNVKRREHSHGNL